MEEEILTVAQAAKRLKKHPATIRYRCKKGLIPGAVMTPFGNVWLIPASSLLLPEVKKQKLGRRPKKEEAQ